MMEEELFAVCADRARGTGLRGRTEVPRGPRWGGLVAGARLRFERCFFNLSAQAHSFGSLLSFDTTGPTPDSVASSAPAARRRRKSASREASSRVTGIMCWLPLILRCGMSLRRSGVGNGGENSTEAWRLGLAKFPPSSLVSVNADSEIHEPRRLPPRSTVNGEG